MGRAVPPPPTRFGAAQPAVQRRPAAGAVQRVLEIGGALPQSFNTAAAATAHLVQAYKAHKKLAAFDATSHPVEMARLTEIAEVAGNARYLYVVPDEAAALAYIELATPIKAERFDSTPGETPQRETDDTTPWNFSFFTTRNAPSALKIPQSPKKQSFFPSTFEEASDNLDIAQGIADVKAAIANWKATVNPSVGQNNYSYRVKIHYRLDTLGEFTGSDKKTYFKKNAHPRLSEVAEQGEYFTSKKMKAEQVVGGAQVDVEIPIKRKLDDLMANYERGKYAETSLYSKDRKTKAKTKPPGYFATADIGRISSLFFHSEVQAASDEAAADAVARDVVARMIDDALLKQGVSTTPGGIVVVAVTILSFSDTRTVCGNACKAAVTDIARRLETKVNEHLAAAKTDPRLARSHLSLRRSKLFRVTAHVGADMRFRTDEIGATLETGAPTLKHHAFQEYKP